MNDILSQVEKFMHGALKEKLPQVNLSDLEDNGAVFYMNGKNGTAFDWYVNDHLPCFFMFYGDKENLGAVKAMLYNDCNMSVYVYGEKGHAQPVELNYDIDTDAKKLFDLAVLLTDKDDLCQVDCAVQRHRDHSQPHETKTDRVDIFHDSKGDKRQQRRQDMHDRIFSHDDGRAEERHQKKHRRAEGQHHRNRTDIFQHHRRERQSVCFFGKKADIVHGNDQGTDRRQNVGIRCKKAERFVAVAYQYTRFFKKVADNNDRCRNKNENIQYQRYNGSLF